MSDTKGYINKKEEGDSLYEELRLEALEIIQKITSETWTDYNEHDPGVTLIENIAYTITELSHKTLAPIQDLLIKSKGKKINSGENGFFAASDILTTGPITFNDYRKIWIDQIINVKNVWIYPVDDYQGDVQNTKGLLHVYVEKYEYKSDPSEESSDNERIIRELRANYNGNRNLCEDLYDVEIYKALELTISSNITLSSAVNGEEILAKMFHEVSNYLVPDVKYYSLWELQSKHTPTNEIFNGPNLLKGFILDEDLKDPLKEIVISDILKIITKIPGIISVNDFYLQYESSSAEEVVKISDRFLIPKNRTAIALFPESSKNIVFENSHTYFHPDLNETRKQLSFIRALNYDVYKEASSALNTMSIPEGKYLDVTSYYPIRKQFPELYGIGDRGIGNEVTTLRKAQVKQLKAYLIPFDQLMLNFLAQLSNVNTLFSVNNDNDSSYFTKVLPDIEELIDLIKSIDGEFDIAKWEKTLNDINNSFDTNALGRFNEIANHLLSRFNETFQTYALRKINTSSYGDALTNTNFEKKLLKSKRKLVHDYGSISYDRAGSFNYHQDEDESQANPGILRKLAILMGINDFKRKSLIKVLKDSGIRIHPMTLEVEVVVRTIIIIIIPEEHLEIIEIEEVIVDEVIKDNLYRVMHYVGDKEAVLNDTLKNGVITDNYKIKKTSKGDLHYVFYKNPNQEFNIAHITKTQAGAAAAIKKAVNNIVAVNQESEGFFMIEHLLLLPPYQKPHFWFQINFWFLDSLKFNLVLAPKEFMACSERDDKITKFVDQLFLGELKYSVVSQDDCYGFEVWSTLKDGEIGEFLTVSYNEYATEEEANTVIDILKGIITKIDKDQLESIITCYVDYGNNEEPIEERFFSFKASFILPSWPVRFQNKNFKKMFENTVYEEFPIHINYDIHWVDYEKLKIFETSYFKWLKVSSIEGYNEARTNLAYELILILQELIKQKDEV